jgi:hypothetical protein
MAIILIMLKSWFGQKATIFFRVRGFLLPVSLNCDFRVISFDVYDFIPNTSWQSF